MKNQHKFFIYLLVVLKFMNLIDMPWLMNKCTLIVLGPLKSGIWHFFERVAHTNRFKCTVINQSTQQQCGRELSYTHVWPHLRNLHSDAHMAFTSSRRLKKKQSQKGIQEKGNKFAILILCNHR